MEGEKLKKVERHREMVKNNLLPFFNVTILAEQPMEKVEGSSIICGK